jgi:hypothetical protein
LNAGVRSRSGGVVMPAYSRRRSCWSTTRVLVSPSMEWAMGHHRTPLQPPLLRRQTMGCTLGRRADRRSPAGRHEQFYGQARWGVPRRCRNLSSLPDLSGAGRRLHRRRPGDFHAWTQDQTGSSASPWPPSRPRAKSPRAPSWSGSRTGFSTAARRRAGSRRPTWASGSACRPTTSRSIAPGSVRSGSTMSSIGRPGAPADGFRPSHWAAGNGERRQPTSSRQPLESTRSWPGRSNR